MNSLLDKSGEQPELLPSSALPSLFFGECPSEPRNPEYTAERYHKHFPEEYRIMVSLLFGDMLPIAMVSRMMGRSRNLVDAVYAREANGKTVEQLKQQAAREYRHLGKLGREALHDYMLHLPPPEKLKADQLSSMIQRLAVAIGIVDDKAELLSGGVTQRIEHTSAESKHSELLDYLAKLKTEYQARMGLEGETSRQKDGAAAIDITAQVEAAPLPAAPRAEIGAATELPAEQALSDKESDAQLRKDQ